jgi:hypothetical protein
MHKHTTFFVAILLTGTVSGVAADTLLIESMQQAAGLERPARGDSMAQVEGRFGAPEQVVPAVGQPPITRWVYPGFTVYFEGDRVVHAVARR